MRSECTEKHLMVMRSEVITENKQYETSFKNDCRIRSDQSGASKGGTAEVGNLLRDPT